MEKTAIEILTTACKKMISEHKSGSTYASIEQMQRQQEWKITLDAMNEYSRQEAIAFAKFTQAKGWMVYNDLSEKNEPSYGKWTTDWNTFFTTAELYELFKNEPKYKP